MIKKILLPLALAALSLPALAENHNVRMLNAGSDGPMAFEPAFLQIAPGDSVTFIPVDPGHNSSLIAGPDGSASWTGKINEEITVTFDRPGVYLYQCDPHVLMAMVGLIQVGNAGNLDAINKAAAQLSTRFVLNKDRLANYLNQVQ